MFFGLYFVWNEFVSWLAVFVAIFLSILFAFFFFFFNLENLSLEVVWFLLIRPQNWSCTYTTSPRFCSKQLPNEWVTWLKIYWLTCIFFFHISRMNCHRNYSHRCLCSLFSFCFESGAAPPQEPKHPPWSWPFTSRQAVLVKPLSGQAFSCPWTESPADWRL